MPSGRTDPAGLPLADGTDFSQNLFYRQPVSDATQGVWLFDAMPHRVIVVDQLNKAPLTGIHRRDAQRRWPERPVRSNARGHAAVHHHGRDAAGHAGRASAAALEKAVGDTQASIHTREDVATVRRLIGREHKLYRGAIALFVRGRDHTQLEERCITLSNVLLGAGLVPVEPQNEVDR